MADYSFEENLGLPEKPRTDPIQYRAPYLDLFNLFVAIRRLAAYISNLISDSPHDGKTYGRDNGAWVPVTEEAPIDGNQYARKNGAWSVVAAAGGYVRYGADHFYAPMPGWWGFSTTTDTLPANTNGCLGYPVYIDGSGNFQVALNCISYPGSPLTWKLGLYKFRASTYGPGVLAVDLGTLVVNGTGWKRSASTAIPAGLYMLVMFTNFTTTGTCMNRNYNSNTIPNCFPSGQIASPTPPTRAIITQTYPAGAIPSDLTANAVTLQTGVQYSPFHWLTV